MLKRRIAVCAVVALSASTISPLAAHADSTATTYYVQQGGSCSDSGAGTQAAPFCTITAAAAVATTPGDTVLIGQGNYSGEVDITASGTAAAPITFESTLPTPTSVLSAELHLDGASYVNVSGIWFYGGTDTHAVNVENSSHVTLNKDDVDAGNVSVTGNSGNDTFSRIEWFPGNASFSGGAFDIDSSGTGNVLTTSVVDVGENGGSGVDVTGSANAVITGNTIYGFCGAGIAIADDSNGVASGATIENNVVEYAVTDANDENNCESATTAGISVQTAADESGLTESYNDVYPADSVNTEVYDWAGTAYQTPAAFTSATGQGTADSIANPEVNAGGAVKDETSPVINAANSNAPGELTTDLNGNARVFDPNVAETGAGTQGYDRGAVQFAEVVNGAALTFPSTQTAPAGTALPFGTPTPTDNWAHATFSYVIDFGDGTPAVTAGAGASVPHTYATAGTYTINYTVTSSFGKVVKGTYGVDIVPAAPVTANLQITPEDNALGLDWKVSATSPWTIDSELIDFGDGTTWDALDETDYPDKHIYSEPGVYTVSLTVTDAGGNTKTVSTQFTTKGSDFSPMNPTRVLDTRKGLGGTSAALANNGSIKLKVAGVDGIPSSVTAVDLNLTAVGANGNGYVQANTGSNNGTSTVDYGKSAIYSNSVIAQVASDGTVTLRNFGGSAAVKLDLIADITGYFATDKADKFDFVTTSRIMDTRDGTGGSTGALAAGKADVLTVNGAGSLPATGVDAVAVNVTVTGTTGSGYLVAYADGASTPTASDLDWQGGTTKATNVLVPVGSDGKIDLYNGSANGGTAQVIVDVTGYFTTSTAGDVYVPVTAVRVLDSRKTTAINAAAGRKFVMPSALNRPDLDGYVFNATATQTRQAGWLLLSNGQSGTSTSTVNWTGSGQTVANLAIVGTQPTPYAAFAYNGSPSLPVQAVVDAMGYFAHTPNG